MTRRLAWLNEKGGSGKSTSALNLAANLAEHFSKKVLLVDSDHQANITAVLIGDTAAKKTLSSVILDQVPTSQAICHTRYDNLDLLAADPRLADVNIALADPTGKLGVGREQRLKRALAEVDATYDFVIIDTGPQRTLLNINVLNYVQEVYVPIDPGIWSMMGVQNLESLIGEMTKYMNSSLRLGGVLLTKVQRTNVAREVESQVRAYFGDRVFKSTIPLNIKVEEAHSRGQSVLEYAPESAGAQAYLAFTHEVVHHA